MHESGGRPGGHDRLVLLGAAGTGEKLDRPLVDGDLAPHDDPLVLGVDPDFFRRREAFEFRMAIRDGWRQCWVSSAGRSRQHENR